MTVKALPDVKSYLSVHLYLQDMYAYRKSTLDSFSYETWAYDLNVPSKSSLRFAVLGKRKISESLAEAFCQNLNLPGDDKTYFILLVHYTQATSAERKRAYGQLLTQTLRRQLNIQELEPMQELLFDPAVMALRDLLSFDDLLKTPDNLAKLLNMRVEIICDFLSRLEKLDLAEQSEEQWSAKQESVRVETTPNSEAILQYHKLSLQRAIAAQTTMTPDERHYNGMSMAMTPDEHQEYITEINNFLSQLFNKYNNNQFSGRRLYQVNLNLIPWTIS
jgi:uncharacterized protein (TIGR02147 family)